MKIKIYQRDCCYYFTVEITAGDFNQIVIIAVVIGGNLDRFIPASIVMGTVRIILRNQETIATFMTSSATFRILLTFPAN